jgi:tRNA pseudouridine(38-40) synthase
LGWGRTDAGVHAHGAVCTVDLSMDEVKRLSSKWLKDKNATSNNTPSGDHSISSDELAFTATILQSALKEFACGPSRKLGLISARRCTCVPPTFDARFSCIWKRYVYTISCSKSRSPFLSRYAWEIDTILDYDAMVKASLLLSGRHDFSWLSVIEPGDKMDPIRNLNLVVDRLEGNSFLNGNPFTQYENEHAPILFRISATTDFFLYKMTRRIVGALVAIGSGKVNLCDLEDCIQRHDSATVVTTIPKGLLQTAPACGLTLDHVEYNITI